MKKLPIHIDHPVLIIILITLLLRPVLWAQENFSADKRITVKSNPVGAVVHLDGEYQFIGRTPFVIPYTVIGKYDVTASKVGYSSVRRTITFSGNSPVEFQLKLLPKTRIKAVSRSIVAPGWGQFYADRKKVGGIYGVAAATSLVFLVQTQMDYLTASRDYEALLTRAEIGLSSYNDQMDLIDEIENSWKNLEEKTDKRNLNIYILGGIWALNILDSFFFFPNYAREVDIFEKFSMNVVPVKDGIAMGMRFSLD